jgi:signal transduction histidine kinase
LQGSDNKLYIGTNQGFCELLSGKNETDRYVVGKVFNTKTGYPVKDVNVGPGAMYKDSKGIIWIGTGSDKTGLVRFDPTAIVNANPDPPSLVIQGIKINNETICWNDLVSKQTAGKSDSTAAVSPNITEEITSFGRQLSDVERDSIRKKFGDISFTDISKWYPIPENLVLPYKHNNIGFDFNAIETGRNFLVKYQYMLQGYDKDWSPPSNVSSASFGNIHEGTYTFKLKALSPDGIWSKPVEYTFKVLPPWWRTWWMYIVYVILIVAVLISSVWWNNRRIIAQKKKLEHKVTVATKQIREEKNKVEEQKKKIEETLSELKSTQAQLIQSEKMASLGELTAGIAHEIQNPLNFVNNFSEVNEELIEELKTEKLKPNNERNEQSENELLNDISQNLQKINFHGKRADAIVKSMLQHSRKTTGQKELADINALADEYLRLAYHGLRAKDKSFNAKMATDFDPTLEKINIVPQEIGRVILNLINNAFYAVSEKQKACQAEHVEAGYEPTVTVSTKKIENKVEIKIKDNGNGIPQKILDKIFQPFFTTKPSGQGTGLGLSLSYDIVTKGHGGEFKVETTEGEGSEFIVLLPENSANKI